MMKDYVLKNGLIVGTVQVVLLLVSYMLGLEFMLATWWGVAQFLIVLGLVVFFTIDFKKQNGGYATFKESFTVMFGVYAAASFILTFFNILLYNVIDPEFAVLAKEQIIEKTYEMLAGFGTPESAVDEAILAIEEQDSFSVGNLAKGYVFGLPLFVFISLIGAAIIKKNKPEFEA